MSTTIAPDTRAAADMRSKNAASTLPSSLSTYMACHADETREHEAAIGRLRAEYDRLQSRMYLEESIRLLELARNAQRLFEKQETREKRRLLNFVVSNCTWKGGKLVADLRQPFDVLAETTAIAAQAAAGKRANLAKTEIWLPGPDSNQRPTG